MSTHASISMFNHETEKFHSVYLHFDGYPSHVLPILNERFGTYEKAEQLLSYGDMSVIGFELEPDDGDVHNFNTQQPDVCVFYNRDRGETEEFTKAQRCLSKLEISKEEFNYFFDEQSGWNVVV